MTNYILTCDNCYTKNDKSKGISQVIAKFEKKDQSGALMGVCIGCGEQLLIIVDSNHDARLISRYDTKPKDSPINLEIENIDEHATCKTEAEADQNIDAGQKSFMKEDYVSAYKYWKKAYNWYEQNNPQSEIVLGLLNNIGMTRTRLKQPQKALEYFLKILPLINERNAVAYATTLNNIGGAYLHLGDLENAEDFHYRAFEVDLKNKTDENVLASHKGNIIFVYNERIHKLIAEEHYSKALQYEDKCIEVYRKTSEETPIRLHNLRKGNHFYNWGNLEYKKGNLELARDYLLKALEFHKLVNAHNSIKIDDMNLLSDVYREMGNIKEGLLIMKELDTLAKSTEPELPTITGRLRK